MCLLALASGIGIVRIPKQAAIIFGQPSPNLGLSQQYLLSTQMLIQRNDLTKPLLPASPERPFSVDLGEPIASITNRLQRDGLISNANALRNFMVYAGLDTTVQAGKYLLSPGMTALEIAQALQDATPAEVTFNILPGWRMEEIAEALPTSGLTFTPEAFLTLARQGLLGNSFNLELPAGASLEGFLFPDSYLVARQSTPEEFISKLLENFKIKISTDLLEGFSDQGLSLYQAVILASIVEREAVDDTEMPTIASVFLNRLKANMKLDADPTVQYSLGYNPDTKTWWTSPLSQEDLQFDSPYNTYLFPGLPRAPISNPSLKALQAVAFPDQTSYYYFRAACDKSGKHLFAETYDQHLQNACE